MVAMPTAEERLHGCRVNQNRVGMRRNAQMERKEERWREEGWEGGRTELWVPEEPAGGSRQMRGESQPERPPRKFLKTGENRKEKKKVSVRRKAQKCEAAEKKDPVMAGGSKAPSETSEFWW